MGRMPLGRSCSAQRLRRGAADPTRATHPKLDRNHATRPHRRSRQDPPEMSLLQRADPQEGENSRFGSNSGRVRTSPFGTMVRQGEEVRFAIDSPVEKAGFEPSVPRKRDSFFKFAHQMAAHKAYAQRSSVIAATTRSLILRGFNSETATMRPDSAGHCIKKLLEIRTTPSSVPARKSWRCTEKRRDTVRLRRCSDTLSLDNDPTSPSMQKVS